MITLKTLPQATEQEVFDQVAKHLLTQGEKSEIPEVELDGAKCMYRHANLKCAAGCLIADEEYTEDLEGTDWYGLAHNSRVPQQHIELIALLQRIHDESYPTEWYLALKHFALNRKLNTTNLDKAAEENCYL